MLSYSKEISRDGFEILKIKDRDKEIYLGSYYRQGKEIDKMYKQLDNLRGNDTYIIIGLGNGEVLEQLLKNKVSKNKILIIEHNDNWIEEFKKEKKDIDFNQVNITSREIDIRRFMKDIHSNIVENIRVLYTFNYDKILREKTMEVIKIIKEEITKLAIDRNTNLMFKNYWFRSIISNLIYGNEAMAINKLENKFKNIPAIIVSAGPSLSKNIKELNKYEGKGLIITGGRTLRPLLENNIKPDLLGVIDASKASYELVEENLNDIDVPLLFCQGTNEDIVKKHNYKKIIASNNKLYEKLWGNKFPVLNLGGSVAHTITCAAIYLGCNPIIFVGQDLAYTDNKGHSDIAFNVKDEDKSTDIKRYEKDTDIFVEGVNGEKIKTSLSLNDFRISFENIIEHFKETKFINATEGGANINGAKNRKLIDVINELPKVNIENINEFINSESKLNQLRKVIDEMFKECDKIIKNCNRGKSELDKLKIKFENKENLQSTLKTLDKIDKKIRGKNIALGFISDYIYGEIYIIECKEEFIITENDSEEEKFEKIYNKNKNIYNIIITCLKDTMKSIENTLSEYEEGKC